MKRAWIAVSAALVLAGVAAIVSVSVATRHAARADHWMQVRATVERVEGGSVAYRYEAGGTTHGGTAPARKGAIYTVGGPVLVYVNPANAAESLLDLPPRPATWPTAAGVVMLLAGAALGFWSWQGARPKEGSAPRQAPAKGTGDTTSRRRKAPPLARLQPPPGANWKRGDEETPT